MFGWLGSRPGRGRSDTVGWAYLEGPTSRRRAQVSANDEPGVPPEQAPERTTIFKADFSTDTETPAGEPAVAGVDALPAGSALLVVKRGPNAGSRFLLDRDTTSAGRHPDSDIFLDDVTVSRRHAEFRREGGEFLVIDVGSLNGTYVNREPVDHAVLANSDEVQIGKFRLVFLTGPGTGGQEGS
ncbi:MAG: FHA domain-containing protein [Kutzneria sp.]|nr:FHA domain-containing protein [Kutzneria sp.]MBV9844399.1 FHA domain-containing protein [Kutzneria sp.]